MGVKTLVMPMIIRTPQVVSFLPQVKKLGVAPRRMDHPRVEILDLKKMAGKPTICGSFYNRETMFFFPHLC
jgi:hypothetical protein